MARLPNIFQNPATGYTYSWLLNHSEEETVQKSLQIADGAPTGNIGLLPQQGAATPLIFQWKGTILTKAQLVEMIGWFQVCVGGQTIYLTDFSGSKYEVLITEFNPTRKAVAGNHRDLVNAPLWIWDYSISFRVLTIFSGEWSGVTP